jgi:hypothetical protein
VYIMHRQIRILLVVVAVVEQQLLDPLAVAAG